MNVPVPAQVAEKQQFMLSLGQNIVNVYGNGNVHGLGSGGNEMHGRSNSSFNNN
jgi:hypothetical protein